MNGSSLAGGIEIRLGGDADQTGGAEVGPEVDLLAVYAGDDLRWVRKTVSVSVSYSDPVAVNKSLDVEELGVGRISGVFSYE